MRRCQFWIFTLVLLPSVEVRADSAVSPTDKRIGELIKQLGSNRFSDREKAGRALEAVGEPALGALRKAAKDADLETSRRATEIMRRVEEKATVTRLLAPKRLRLKVEDAAVLDAVRELEKQSGCKIVVQGNVGGKKVTLDTGLTTFWEALDQLCGKAGLAELSLTGAMQPPAMQPASMQPPAGFPRIKVKPPALPGGILPVVPPAGNQGKAPLLQVQAGQLRPLAPPPMAMPFSGAIPTNGNMPIILTVSNKPIPPTCYAGAVRIRLSDCKKWRPDELTLTLDAAAEPGVPNFTLDGTARVDLAGDDQGQKLQLAPAPKSQAGAGNPNVPVQMQMQRQAQMQMRMNNMGFMPMAGPMMNSRSSSIRLKLGEKEARTVKEFKGTLTARALAPTEALITVDNIIKASGRTVKGAHGGSIQVQGVEHLANGDYELKIRLEHIGGANPAGMMMGGGMVQMQRIQIQMGGNMPGNIMPGMMMPAMPFGNTMPELKDKDGKAYHLVGMPSMRMSMTNGQMSQEATLHFRANAGQGAPDRLVCSGRRLVTFPIAFSFKDLRVP